MCTHATLWKPTNLQLVLNTYVNQTLLGSQYKCKWKEDGQLFTSMFQNYASNPKFALASLGWKFYIGTILHYCLQHKQNMTIFLEPKLFLNIYQEKALFFSIPNILRFSCTKQGFGNNSFKKFIPKTFNRYYLFWVARLAILKYPVISMFSDSD